jgi:LacI family transcriptional regulator
VTGVLLAPQENENTVLTGLEWDWFSFVSFGHSLKEPPFHVTTNAQYRSGQLVIRILKNKGYKRIGYHVVRGFDERTEHGFIAPYLMSQYDQPERLRIPPFIYEEGTYLTDNSTRPELRQWIDKHKLDIVISSSHWLSKALRAAGYSVPRDIALATLSHDPAYPKVSGLFQNPAVTGEMAVDILARMIQQGERGIPALRAVTLIDGTWIEGTTTPALHTP